MFRYALCLLSCVAGPAWAQNASATDTEVLVGEYAAAVQKAVVSRWNRPESVPLGARCRLLVQQIPGGTVVSVEPLSDCEYDEAGKRSIMAAVLKAQPLPYQGYEAVFHRRLNLTFVARDSTPAK
jgi:colicin import membrane protein